MSADETLFRTEAGVRISASSWDDNGAWMHFQAPGVTFSAVLTRDEALRLIDGLQKAIDAMEAA